MDTQATILYITACVGFKCYCVQAVIACYIIISNMKGVVNRGFSPWPENNLKVYSNGRRDISRSRSLDGSFRQCSSDVSVQDDEEFHTPQESILISPQPEFQGRKPIFTLNERSLSLSSVVSYLSELLRTLLSRTDVNSLAYDLKSYLLLSVRYSNTAAGLALMSRVLPPFSCAVFSCMVIQRKLLDSCCLSL